MKPKIIKENFLLYFVFLTNLLATNTYSQSLNFEKVQMIDIATSKIANISFPEKSTVFLFLSPECPLCQNYTKTINDLIKKYQGEFTFIGIFPGQNYNENEIRTFAQKYSLEIKMFLDNNLQLTKALNIKVTPSAVLLKKNKILYFGAIDNWVSTLGKKRNVITAHYLEDAIQESKLGIPIHLSNTEPIGCIINEY